MKTIIEMAREAGLEEMWELTPRFVERLKAFEALVAAAANARANTSWALMCKKMVAAEVEACAKVCEGMEENNLELRYEYRRAVLNCADAIRARGQA